MVDINITDMFLRVRTQAEADCGWHVQTRFVLDCARKIIF